MNKKLKPVVITTALSLFHINAQAQQSITLDNSFGTDGVLSIPLIGESDDVQIIESSDNKLFVFGKDIPSSVSIYPNKIHKLNTNGTFDTTFGSGGTIILPNYISSYTIVPQGQDKFLVTFQRTTIDSSPKISILRYDLATGQIDTTFGINGEFTTNFDGANGFRNNNACVLSDNSIIVSTGTKFIKLLSNGNIDPSYGNNGIINQNNSGCILMSGSDLLNFYNDKINKTTLNGTIVSNFGINGTFTYPSTSYYYAKQNLDGTINSLDSDNNKFYQLNSNGILLNTFLLTNNLIEYSADFFNTGNNIYFVGVTYSDHPFITCYDQNGNIIQINNQNLYTNTTSTGVYTSIVVKNNTIYAAGYKFNNGTHHHTITKYNITNSTLSTGEVKTEKATFNIFPNPVNKGNTLYFNRAMSYELYDMSGKLLGKEKNALTIDTSKLNTGVYLIKTSEGEVKRFIVK